MAALALAAMAGGARAQWSPALWTSNHYRGAWYWTNPAGAVAVWNTNGYWTNATATAMTGTVKDGRSYEMRAAVIERMLAANMDTSALPLSAWYIWERSNLIDVKTAISNALGYYVDAPGLTSGAPSIPTFTPSSMVARLSLPTNFWTYTSWTRLGDTANSNGWRNTQRVMNALTVTVADVSWKAHGATNDAGTLADPVGTGTNWANALADLPNATLTNVTDDVAPQAWVGGQQDGASFYATYRTHFSDATNAAAIWTNASKTAALWWKGTVTARDVTQFDAAGLPIASNTWQAAVAASNIAAASAQCWPAVGPANLDRASDGVEPVTNTTWKGFTSEGKAIYNWTADTNGFRFHAN